MRPSSAAIVGGVALGALGSCALVARFDDPPLPGSAGGASSSSNGGSLPSATSSSTSTSASTSTSSASSGAGGEGACAPSSGLTVGLLAAGSNKPGPLLTGLTAFPLANGVELVAAGLLPAAALGLNSPSDPSWVFAAAFGGGGTPMGAWGTSLAMHGTPVTVVPTTNGSEVHALVRTVLSGSPNNIGSELFTIDPTNGFVSDHAFYPIDPKAGGALDLRGVAYSAGDAYVTGYLRGATPSLDNATIDFDGDAGDTLVIARLGSTTFAKAFGSGSLDPAAFVGESILVRATDVLVAGTFLGDAKQLGASSMTKKSFLVSLPVVPGPKAPWGATMSVFEETGVAPPELFAGPTRTWLLTSTSGKSVGFAIHEVVGNTRASLPLVQCAGTAASLVAVEAACGIFVAGETQDTITCNGSLVLKMPSRPAGFVLFVDPKGNTTGRLVDASLYASLRGVVTLGGSTWIGGQFEGTLGLPPNPMSAPGQKASFLASAP